MNPNPRACRPIARRHQGFMLDAHGDQVLSQAPWARGFTEFNRLNCKYSERFSPAIVLLEHKPQEKYPMPKQAHTEAATHHENAAKSHRSTAEHYGKDDAMSSKHSDEALSHSGKAHEASKNAHAKGSSKK